MIDSLAIPRAEPAEIERLQRKMARLRVPVNCMFELTSRCNLQCVHCYLGPQEEQRAARSRELSTEAVKAMLDEIAAAGTMDLTITGGDPMVRKDFPEIYRHAVSKGLLVTVFCDGILVTDKIIQLFRELPPRSVEVSIYGATEETYEAVTRVKGSFAMFRKGIRRLQEGGIRFALKTVLLQLNKHELHDMERYAKDLGVTFRFDAAVFPCLPNGDHGPLAQRVPSTEAIEIEMASPQRRQDWLDYYNKMTDAAVSPHTYTCGAGVNAFYLDPFGSASPCVMTTQYKYNLQESSFFQLWNEELPKLRQNRPRAEYGCNSCNKRSLCTGCPAFNFLENGAEDVKSEYVCATTHLRYEALGLGNKPASTLVQITTLK